MTGIAVVVLLSLLFTQGDSTSRTVGYVIEARGSWFDEKYGEKIEALSILRADSNVVRKTSVTTDYLRVRLLDTGREERFNCIESLTCSGFLDLAGKLKSPQRAGETQTFLRAILELLSSHPSVHRGYVSLTSRGGPTGLVDGVAPLQPDGIHLEDIFAKVQPGNLLVQLCPIDRNALENCPSLREVSSASWKPGRNLVLKRPANAAGLYKLTLCRNIAEEIHCTGDSAFVLVTTPETFGPLRDQFDKALAQASAWTPADPESTTLLRVYLHSLAFSALR